ncbi:MAG: preprotein translocase subunit SecA [Deltaproteobacteria bacterium]|nr:preprotein translocase subunit SecA [Deltaproteobacteria bacterium]MBW2051304.1 preprotein translocase subunit SecA [Deltaproteobacteria bacterium]MBW2141349.1 preprotein translocase subunit SecA [Deltaproteobacteria bacterium]MBW2322998.1 preprotein translocase subunit SecA [Deltaproteobacteria bacterium]
MFGQVIKKIVGSKNDRELRRLNPQVQQVGDLEPEIKKLSDDQLRAKTGHFKEQLANGASIDDLLPEAFAVVREASVRTLGMRHFDVQIIGGIVLHEGKIAEMKTGEGKTLAATLPVYLNALTGKGVHVVTVNDYLARRDAEWMGAIYKFLGLSVGVIVHDMNDADRRESYASDVTYGTNNEFGFDYLRDNMKFSLDDYVQREYYFCIVDEVDSILIDEARTPLIISGPSDESTELYYRINQVIPKLKAVEDYTIDEKARTSTLTEEGISHAEKILKIDNLYDPKYLEILHHLNQALKAHALFKRDVDYIVKSGEVIIVDEFTGRLMPGRRYSDGLHQALEAKEGVKIEHENQTLASITFQNYFRMYDKLSGMTGTADTEAAEFRKIYNLDVVVVPTNEEMIRVDYPDVIYRSEKEKFNAVVEEIAELNAIGRPVLVGTISIEKSELLSKMLKRKGIPHNVLNAKHHEKEAEIVAQAGQMGGVTISTNMAGRGTDIVLGEGVADLGGLHILGTERHESRRIDNQLRGRSGRQGDMGTSRFYLSLEDDLLRIFGAEHIQGIMSRLGMDNGEPIENKLVTRAIENAQRKVEGHHFDIRKHLLEYDDVMNQQRDVIYRQRRNILAGENLKDEIFEMIEDLVDGVIENFTDEKSYAEEWDLKALEDVVFELFGLRLDFGPVEDLTQDGLREKILDQVREAYQKKEEEFGAPIMRELEHFILLQSLDNQWKDHLLSMDHLKEGIGLRGYGQRDPLREYQKEGYEVFMEMVERIKAESISLLFHIRPNREESLAMLTPQEQEMQMSHGESEKRAPVKREGRKIGRNEPCPCGSGKKYKKCCGQNV